MLGNTQPPGYQEPLKPCLAILPGPGGSTQCLLANWEEAPQADADPWGLAEQKVPLSGGNGPLSLERCSPARTQGSVSGGLLNGARLCSDNFSARQDSSERPLLPLWLQSIPICRALLGGCPGEQDLVLGHEASDPPGRTGLPPAGSRGRQWPPQRVDLTTLLLKRWGWAPGPLLCTNHLDPIPSLC